MQLPITIGLHRSSFLGRLIVLVALAASLAVPFFPVGWMLRLALLVAIGVLAVFARISLSRAMPCIRLEADGRISLLDQGLGEPQLLQLLPHPVVHPWLTVFRLQASSGATFVMIATIDSLEKDEFRRLRIFLRWRAALTLPNDGA